MEFHHDVIIIGGGIAGISAAQYTARQNLSTLVIEELAVGGQVLYVNALEDFPGFSEPVSGIDFSMRMERQARNFGVEFKVASVRRIEKKRNSFTIHTDNSELNCRGVVLASGSRHRTLGVPGEEEFNGKGVSYCGTCDGPFYKNRKILVIGGGDKACKEAEYLSGLTEKLTIIHRGPSFAAMKSNAEKMLGNPRVSVQFSTMCTEICGTDRVRSATLENTRTGKTSELQTDGVFIFIGSSPRTELVPDLEKDADGYLVTNDMLCTSVPGLYAAGDVRSMNMRTLVSGAADGALAGKNLSEYLSGKKDAAD